MKTDFQTTSIDQIGNPVTGTNPLTYLCFNIEQEAIKRRRQLGFIQLPPCPFQDNVKTFNGRLLLDDLGTPTFHRPFPVCQPLFIVQQSKPRIVEGFDRGRAGSAQLFAPCHIAPANINLCFVVLDEFFNTNIFRLYFKQPGLRLGAFRPALGYIGLVVKWIDRYQ